MENSFKMETVLFFAKPDKEAHVMSIRIWEPIPYNNIRAAGKAIKKDT